MAGPDFRTKAAVAGVIAAAFCVGVFAGEDSKKAKINYQEQILPIIRNRCASCHNADKQKGGLALDDYGSAMRGGSSGKVIEPGDLDSSGLWHAVNHSEQPFMPPNSPKIPDPELALIKQWIEGGAPETSGSAVAIPKKPKFDFKLDPSALGKPQGSPAMPEGVLTQPFVTSSRANAVMTLAASPWAPVVAVAGHKQVLLYQTSTFRLIGVLPFPEGTIHALKFSRNGSLLLAGGGRGGQAGKAVVWDVKTGKRVFEVGKEYDSVLAADISPDHGLVAIGGPNRIVRVYRTADESLAYEEKKHTEWITALEFSPDGVLLASGDRNGGLFVWEAETGREFHELRGHSAAITEVNWRPDSNVLASSSEDSTVRLWGMENGGNIKAWGAHGGGTESVRFAKDGRLVTAGRDRVCRVWDQNGGKQRDLEGFGDIALKAVFTHDDQAVVSADFTGETRVHELKDGKRLANLLANPAPIETRLALAERAFAEAKSAADAAAKELQALTAAANQTAAKVASAAPALKAAEELVGKLSAEKSGIDSDLRTRARLEPKAGAALKTAQDELAKAQAAAAEAQKSAAAKAQVATAKEGPTKAAKSGLDNANVAKNQAGDALVAAASALKASKTKAEADALAMKIVDQAKAVAAAAANCERAEQALALANAEHQKALGESAAAAKAYGDAQQVVAERTDLVLLAQAAVEKVQADKAALAARLGDTEGRLKAAAAAAPARKTELDQANAANAAAAKALADRTAAVQPAIGKVQSLEVEIKSLAAEKKAFETFKAAQAQAEAKTPAKQVAEK